LKQKKSKHIEKMALKFAFLIALVVIAALHFIDAFPGQNLDQFMDQRERMRRSPGYDDSDEDDSGSNSDDSGSSEESSENGGNATHPLRSFQDIREVEDYLNSQPMVLGNRGASTNNAGCTNKFSMSDLSNAVNSYRRSKGLSALEVHGVLCATSLMHSADLSVSIISQEVAHIGVLSTLDIDF
jgi:hypothetical protein